MSLRRGLFSTKWQAGLARTAETAMAANIDVYTPSTDKTYNVDTDTWTRTADTVHYTGKARVQPLRSSRESTGTTVQRVRFQIPVAYIGFLRVDQQVRVNVSPLNPALAQYQYVVVEVVDSSNPFEATFECSVNDETLRS